MSNVPNPSASLSDISPEELTARRNRLADSVDKLVEPLDHILAHLQVGARWFKRGAVAASLGAFLLLVLVGVQIHNVSRMSRIEEALDAVIAKQAEMKADQLVTQQAVKAADAKIDEATASANQVQLVPGTDAKGKPSAVLVISPPRGAITPEPGSVTKYESAPSHSSARHVHAPALAAGTVAIPVPLPSDVQVVDPPEKASEAAIK